MFSTFRFDFNVLTFKLWFSISSVLCLTGCVYHRFHAVGPRSTSPEATKEFVKLLAVYEDIQRDLRSAGDEPCHMIRDIREGVREVVFDKSENYGTL